ncbi:D-inositol 3-phosphate glycosyltransferase 2 protein [Marine Group I thaumarchaeote SCGC AAA799-E16]|uniref:Glycoside hydrolase family protein n=2 Tax=Marine Group I TaxID=905826 RepID=A0A087S253_9ARCH|nr:D-inositol 3-phosphate glycosyltransferase 2 protein [Marine Group I thaumarchaeote SCGC AAA799-E16]KFM19807.1 glycoside hydrolase family protein [Marine Group I thaumarchaeote SCGC RSA3]
MSKEKKKNVLIISQYFPPDTSGGGTRSYNYARCLSEQDLNVTVITAYPHLHGKTKKKIFENDAKEKFSIIRVWIPPLLHSSIKNRIILHIGFILSSLKPIFSVKADVVFASEPNLFSIIPSYFYSKIKGAKIIRVVDDLWPEVFYERKIVKSKILKKILNKLARFSYNFPEYILPLTKEAKIHISKLYNIDMKKIIVITHGVDIDKFYPIEQKDKKEFVIMYSGALVESYDFELIFKVAEKMKNEKIKFVIRGKGTLTEFLKIKKNKLKLTNLIINEKFVESDKISHILSEADVFIVPLKKDYFLNLSLPTKILEFQALAKPIICCSNGAPARYIEKTNSGIAVTCNNPSDLIQAIKKLKNDKELCSKLGKNGNKFVHENLTFEQIGIQLKDLISRLN